ncbi:MAG: glycoside hydrolase family 3 C-terminal domain-containing protein [Oscillospiraceae bacterium]
MKYNKWISRLTIRERAQMLTGKDFWHLNGIKSLGLPSIMLTDGPHGLRKSKKDGNHGSYTVKSTCFPTASALACTWDKGLMREIGNALGEECVQEKVSILLGPGINIKRSPLCGRNFEYFSEDPVVAGELGAEFINGVQEKNVGACIKHFAANSTETRRFKCNAIVDERALREIYLRGFEIAVKKSQPWAVMSAYNKINGIYCTENDYLQNQILRKEWGFGGAVISDWMATDDRVKALNAGLDIEMPSTGYYNVNKIAQAYRDNVVTPETLNTSVNRVLDIINKSEHNLIQSNHFVYNQQQHHILAEKAAEKSIVLLKNEDGILPLVSGQKVAIIGSLAKEPIYQGYGSSKINAFKVEKPYDHLQAAFPDAVFAKGYEKNANDPDFVLLEQAKRAASSCDVVVIFVGACDSDVCEGFDRVDMRLPKAQTEVIKTVCNVNRNVIVVATGGSCVEMPWHNSVKAIIYTYLLGEGGGKAVSNILCGKASPSGKLAESFPFSINDTPAKDYYAPADDNLLEYRESILVGYRYYEKAKVPVLFPFGHGLSYTKFNYTGMDVSAGSITENDTIDISVEVENAGNYDGEEIVQLYVSKEDTRVFRPEKELKAFERVELKAGEKKNVEFALDRKAFEYFSSRYGEWCLESGKYTILVGSSSVDLRLAVEIDVNSSNKLVTEITYSECSPSYFTASVKQATDGEFEALLGCKIEEFRPEMETNRLTKDCTLADAMCTPVGVSIEKMVRSNIERLLEGDEISQKMAYDSIMYNSPIKRFTAVSSGMISEEMIDGFVHLLNSGDKKQSSAIILKGISGTIKSLIPKMLEGMQ